MDFWLGFWRCFGFFYCLSFWLYLISDFILNNIGKDYIQRGLPNISKCNGRCFLCQDHFIPRNYVKSTLYNKKFQCLLTGQVNCKTNNIIYLLECKNCQLQYVGETINNIYKRFSGHKTTITKEKTNNYLVQHCNNGTCSVSNLTITILENLDLENFTKEEKNNKLRRQEEYWIHALGTAYPFGLNDRVAKYGDMSNVVANCINGLTEHPSFNCPTKRKNRSRGHRKNNKKNYLDLNAFLIDLGHIFETNGMTSLIKSLNKLSRNNLIKVFWIAKNSTTCNSKNKLIYDAVCILAKSKFISKYNKSDKIVNKDNRLYLSINFCSKQIEDINLPRILNQRRVKNALPCNLVYNGSPILTYKFSKTIGQMIFNYNSILKKLDRGSNWKPVCNCEQFLPYVDQTYEHIVTGDLSIIKHRDLQNIMKMGAKFRLSYRIRPADILRGLKNDLNLFIDNWCKKEKITKDRFQNWINLILTSVRNSMYRINPTDSVKNSIFYNANMKQAIANIQNEFIIVPVDKASNNFAIICQKLYCDILSKELQTTNTYEKAHIEENSLIENIEERILKKFNIKINDNDKQFPFLYWTIKFHKNPPKPRFIAGAARCPTRIAATDLSLILGEIRNKFKAYCSGIKKFSNFNPYWSVNNSLQVIDSLANVSAKRVDSFDFTTLYTNLSLNLVFEKLKMVIKKSFLLSNIGFLKIDTFNKKARWTNFFRSTINSRCYSLDMVCDLLEFVLFNTFIRFNGNLYKQTVGIPMGGNASPFIADLFLSQLEYEYMINKNSPSNVKYNLSNNKRYLDDLLVINCAEFIEISKNIYPQELILEPSYGMGHSDHFLDLNINISNNNKLVFKLYNKTDDFNFEVINFPFLESNIHSNITYSAYYSQLFRYAKICSNYTDFKNRCKKLSEKLILRGFSAKKISWQFKKFSFMYHELLSKYTKNYKEILNDILI